jgi:hypothetical protein
MFFESLSQKAPLPPEYISEFHIKVRRLVSAVKKA